MNAQSSSEVGRLLRRLTSPVAVKAAISECNQLGRDEFLLRYGFKPSTKYVLETGSGEYDSKAIAGVAFGYQHGVEPLAYDECHGGSKSGEAGWALDRLGFKIRGIDHKGWWLDEVERTVDAYFEMFALRRAGQKLSNKEWFSRLNQEDGRRSAKAYEYKFQNISAALNELGLEWLPGFAPKTQYQKLVRFVLEDRFGHASSARDASPPLERTPAHGTRLIKIDWAQRDAQNRELGIGGEKFALEYERRRLIGADKAELAAKVVWNANEADGHGYDVSSFEPDGTKIYIEVKTTTRNEKTGFFVSSNELEVSRKLGAAYRLYRIFGFPAAPNLTVYKGPLDDCLALDPASYRAKPK